MLETTKKLMEQIDEFMETGMQSMNVMDVLNSMDENTLKMYKSCMDILNTSKELAIKQAEIIEDQNEKLDIILSLLKAKAV